MSLRAAVALGGVALLIAAVSVAAMLRPAPTPTLDERAQAVAESLKCPVCHDMSVADSPAPVAAEMRKQIWDRLAAGRTPDQVRAEFVAAYGDWILIAPPRQGVNWVAWLGPFALAAGAVALAAWTLRSWTRDAGSPPPADAPVPPGPRDSHERLLKDALRRLEQEVE